MQQTTEAKILFFHLPQLFLLHGQNRLLFIYFLLQLFDFLTAGLLYSDRPEILFADDPPPVLPEHSQSDEHVERIINPPFYVLHLFVLDMPHLTSPYNYY